VKDIHNFTIPGISQPIEVRTYRGEATDSVPPVLVWFHGGGWMLGNLDTVDRVCRRIANRVNVLVVSVNYRLAPEYPAPAGIDDAWCALNWVFEHSADLSCDTSRMAVGGDSAGGNIAALLAIRSRETASPRLIYQVLVYPATDLTASSQSYVTHGELAVGSKNPKELLALYLGECSANDPYVSPAATENLAGLPSAYVVTAEFDPLRDEGFEYARRLSEAGVDTVHAHYSTMAHGFIQFGSITPIALEAIDSLCVSLGKSLNSGEQ
jgi:acetyl esterase